MQHTQDPRKSQEMKRRCCEKMGFDLGSFVRRGPVGLSCVVHPALVRNHESSLWNGTSGPTDCVYVCVCVCVCVYPCFECHLAVQNLDPYSSTTGPTNG